VRVIILVKEGQEEAAYVSDHPLIGGAEEFVDPYNTRYSLLNRRLCVDDDEVATSHLQRNLTLVSQLYHLLRISSTNCD